MPEFLPSSPQEQQTDARFKGVSVTRLLVMATVVSSFFMMKDALSQTHDYEDINLLNPKGGGLVLKSGKDKVVEQKDDHNNKQNETSADPLPSKEKYKPENVCYVGDSYIKGITSEGEVELNVFAKNGRPFVSRGGKWDGNDINTFVLQTLENPDCRMIVMNGGLNDFYSYHRYLDKVVSGLKNAYEKIVGIAREKGIKILIFNVPKIPKLPMDMDENMSKRLHRKAEIDEAIDEFNRFLLTLEGAQIMDTMDILQSACRSNNCRIWRKDNIHPGPRGYKALFDSI